MPKYHITKSGQPDRCGATTRACPLGGEHYDSIEEAALATFEADFAASTVAYAEHWDNNATHVDAIYSKPVADTQPLLPSDDDLDIADLVNEWEDEQFELDFQAFYDHDLEPLTDDDLAEYQSQEDEATAVVRHAAEAARVSDGLDINVSIKAADELQSYVGLKTLDMLAADLAEQAHDDFAAGRISQEELEEAVHVAGALRWLLNPSEGRRHTKREARPIDPELIQALRCLYIKRFGVDPFEQGVSVTDLLQMRQQRLI